MVDIGNQVTLKSLSKRKNKFEYGIGAIFLLNMQIAAGFQPRVIMMPIGQKPL